MADRLTLAKPAIQLLFEASPRHTYRYGDLIRILEQNREAWRLAQSTTAAKFIKYLTDNVNLHTARFELPHRPETVYSWGRLSVQELAVAAKPGAYLTHYSAMSIHELTEQVPKTIYVNVEQRPHYPDPDSLTQESIDRAFRNPQRMTTNIAEHEGHRLVFVNGRFTGQLGVIDHTLATGETVRVTDLERTLIDIAVRPAYSGGVAEVARAYAGALARMDVSRLAEYLKKMAFVYPYEQVVGYYLERAGAKPVDLAPFRKEPFRFDFYLAHGMRPRDTELVERWRLFVPKGF